MENLSDEFLDSWERELENTEIDLREVLIKKYVRKVFQLITQFKSKMNRQIVQEDWLLKTRNHLERLKKKKKKTLWSLFMDGVQLPQG